MAKKQGPRKVGPTIKLTPEFKRRNYQESITRMYANGLVSKETAKALLARAEAMTQED